MDRPNSFGDDYSSQRNESIKVDTFGNDGSSQPPMNPAAAMNLTPADLALMRECVVESLKYRSLPLFAANAAIIYYVNTVKPFARGIKVPIFLSGIGSILLGRYLYGNECADKFINAKHRSAFVDSVRRAYGKPPSDFSDDAVGYGDANDTFSYDPPSTFNARKSERERDSYHNDRDASLSSSWSHDPYSRDDGDQYANEPEGGVKRSVTYEDLRNQNRAKWQAPAYPLPNPRSRPPTNPVDTPKESSDYRSF